jgi:hypothetical protein
MTMGNAVAAFIRHFVEAWLLPTWRKIKKLYCCRYRAPVPNAAYWRP